MFDWFGASLLPDAPPTAAVHALYALGITLGLDTSHTFRQLPACWFRILRPRLTYFLISTETFMPAVLTSIRDYLDSLRTPQPLPAVAHILAHIAEHYPQVSRRDTGLDLGVQSPSSGLHLFLAHTVPPARVP